MLSENIKLLRKEHKISQAALAKELNITQQAVQKWEKGKSDPDIDMLKKIAQYFNVTVDDLLGTDCLPFDYKNLTDLSKKIYDLRVNKRVSRMDIADAIGVNIHEYLDYEIGEKEPSVKILRKISDFFHVSIEYLLGKSATETKELNKIVKNKDNFVDSLGIDELNSENKEELKKYIELLKLKQMAAKNKEEASDEISSI